jgi:hypothetical protein
VSASVLILPVATLAGDPQRRPIRRDDIVAADGAATLARYRADGVVLLGDPPVFGYFDPSGFQAPAEQFDADLPAATGVAAEAVCVALSSDGAVGRLADACLLGDAWSRDPWHWIAAQLPKALLLQDAGYAGAYLVPRDLAIARPALQAIGVPPERIVALDHRLLTVDRLTFTPSISRLNLGHWPVLVARLQNIRQRLLSAPAREPELVFVQLGSARFLKYAYYQALSIGCDAVVIGNDELGEIKYARVEPAQVYSEQAARFAGIYRHIGSNRPEPELLCFQRWFMLRDYMARSGRPAIHLDHDILVYPGVLELAQRAAGYAMNDTAWTNPVATPEGLDGFCRFIWDSYAQGDELDALARKYAFQNVPHLSDMWLLFEYGERRRDQVLSFRHGVSVGFDSNVRVGHGYLADGHLKAIEFIDGKPWCRRPDGTAQQFYTFHCQGIAKPLMERLHTITDPRYLAELDALDSEVLLKWGVPDPRLG